MPQEHAVRRTLEGDLREALWEAAFRQTAIRTAPITMVFTGIVERTEVKYGQRAERYVHIEVGAASENLWLQAGTLGLGTVFMGAFEDLICHQVLGLPEDHRVFGIMPVGRLPEG